MYKQVIIVFPLYNRRLIENFPACMLPIIKMSYIYIYMCVYVCIYNISSHVGGHYWDVYVYIYVYIIL